MHDTHKMVSIYRIIVRPTAVEFLVHMGLAVGVASVNSLSRDGLSSSDAMKGRDVGVGSNSNISKSAHNNTSCTTHPASNLSPHRADRLAGLTAHATDGDSAQLSITGAKLDLSWRQLQNVEYLTDGGNSWIHTAVFSGRPVVVKTLKPECQDVVVAINEIEAELDVHKRLHHHHIVQLLGAGCTSHGVRFVVLERLDGGTLTQRLGYNTRIRDRRRRFWRRKQFSFIEVLSIARAIADAMTYCHEEAISGGVLLHRDLKPDNIGRFCDTNLVPLDHMSLTNSPQVLR